MSMEKQAGPRFSACFLYTCIFLFDFLLFRLEKYVFFIVNRYAYVAPSFWKNRMKGARARLSLIPGAEFSTRAYLSYKRLSYFFVCLHMFLIFAIGINSFEVSNPKAWCRESVSSLRL